MSPQSTTRGEAPNLGINAKLAAQQAEEAEKRDREKSSRKLKWERLAAVRKLMPKNRVSKCIWVQIKYTVEIWKSSIDKPAHFRGVMTCGQAWVCPMCAAKISEYDRRDLEAGIIATYMLGWHIYFLTLTLQHELDDKCAAVLCLLLEAVRGLSKGKFWKRLQAEYSIEGTVTVLEVLYNMLNGWHWHKHKMIFSRRELSDKELDELRNKISDEYRSVAAGLGGYVHPEVGVHLRRASDVRVAEYVAKFGQQPKEESSWGLAREMTKYTSKLSGVEKGVAMFQLLDRYKSGDDRAGELFREFTKAVKGRAQLTWSNGLRAKLDLPPRSRNKKIATDKEQTDFHFASLLKKAWHKIRRQRFESLEAARDMSFDEFKGFMRQQGVEVEDAILTLVSEWDKPKGVK